MSLSGRYYLRPPPRAGYYLKTCGVVSLPIIISWQQTIFFNLPRDYTLSRKKQESENRLLLLSNGYISMIATANLEPNGLKGR